MTYCGKTPPAVMALEILNRYKNRSNTVLTHGTSKTALLAGRWFNGSKTPGYKTIKKRDLPVRFYQAGSRVIRDPGGFAVRVYDDGTTETWTGSAQVYFPTMINVLGTGLKKHSATPTRVAAENLALSKCANMKINVAQSFAERKQTAGLLINSINRFVAFAYYFRKGNFSAANRALGKRRRYFDGKKFPRDTLRPPNKDTFANLWLEYSYGWRPLLGDIYGAAELLAQVHTSSRPTKVVGQISNSETFKQTLTQYGVTAISEAKVNYKAICYLWFDISDYSADMLKSTGISNPALLAWELLPYSFVVDWFIPVGNYLSNLQATHGLKFVKGGTSILTKCIERSRHQSNAYNYKLSGYDCDEDWVIHDRINLTGFPSPELPSFRYDLNWQQVTSGIALLNQLFKR